MAKAELKEVVTKEIVLTLTQKEANILRSILGSIANADSDIGKIGFDLYSKLEPFTKRVFPNRTVVVTDTDFGGVRYISDKLEN